MPASPYTDLDRPPLPERALQRALVVPEGLWQRIDLRAETGSTNLDVAAAARAGEPEGLVVIAERQSAGRGRRDRQWLSPARAGLTLSVLLRPGVADPARGWTAVPNRSYGWLPLLAGVALLDTVRRLCEVDAVLKWPNDLLVHVAGAEAKCAGILAEVVGHADAAPAVVLGIGMNVTTRADELPPTTGLPVTSLGLAGAASTDRDPLLRALLRGLAQWYGRWRDSGGDAAESGLSQAYRQGCATVGRPVRVLLAGGDRAAGDTASDGVEVSGEATTVDADGRLVVRTADGERRIAAGDVVHVR